MIAMCLSASLLAAAIGCSHPLETRPKAKPNIGFYRPPRGAFFFYPCADPCQPVSYGLPYAQPVVGDWTGKGYDSVGVYMNGSFALTIDASTANAQAWVRYEQAGPGAVPIAGDWNGDGRSTTGVYVPSRGVFLLRNDHGNSAPAEVRFGTPGEAWIPVTGDWTGSGRSQLGLYDPESATFHLMTDGREEVRVFGPPHAKPFAGDWSGSGIADVGVFDRARGVLELRNGSRAPITIDVGDRPLDIPLFGRWPRATP